MVNFAEFADRLLDQLRRDVEATADPRLVALLDELGSYPDVRRAVAGPPERGSVVVPMRLRHPRGELALFTVITTFGTPADVTVEELALETFFPADDATAARLRELAAQDSAATDHRPA